MHIVGGGIIGLCTAWCLSELGIQATVIDKGDFTDGTSYGNAGMIVPSHFIPMASPGVIEQGLKWMLNPKSPFYIKPRANKELIQWLWNFKKSANQDHVNRSMPTLYKFNELSRQLYLELSQHPDFDFHMEQKGLLMLYKTAKQEEEEGHLAEKANYLGIKAELLRGKALQDLEPDIELDVLGGIYFPGDAHLYPNILMQQLYQCLGSRGVTFIGKTGVTDFEVNGSKITALKTSTDQTIPVKECILTTGSWTSQLAKKLGVKLLLQDGKGYSITLQKPKVRPSIPTILSEAKVAITPMGEDLRVGGTLELSGLSETITDARVQGIVNSVPKYYKNMSISVDPTTKIWKGYRPCTPDGMPYMGRSTKYKNLIIGTGHGMMGLSLGAASGKLLSELATAQKSSLDLSAMAINRF